MSEKERSAWIVTPDEVDGVGGVWLATSKSDAQGLAMKSAQDAGFNIGIDEAMGWGAEECKALTPYVLRSGQSVEHVVSLAVSRAKVESGELVESLQEREARLVEVLSKFGCSKIPCKNDGYRGDSNPLIDLCDKCIALSQSDPDWLAKRDARMKAEGMLLALGEIEDEDSECCQKVVVAIESNIKHEPTRLRPDGGE